LALYPHRRKEVREEKERRGIGSRGVFEEEGSVEGILQRGADPKAYCTEVVENRKERGQRSILASSKANKKDIKEQVSSCYLGGKATNLGGNSKLALANEIICAADADRKVERN